MRQSKVADRIPHMTDAANPAGSTIRDRIRDRMDALGLNPNSASLNAGLSRDFLTKFLSNPDQSIRADSLNKLAVALETTPAWLLSGGDLVARSGEVRSADVDVPATATLAKDVPVLGTAAANHLRGAFQFEGGAIDYVRRPAGLAGKPLAYAIYVEGTSMEPAIPNGDLRFVDPNRAARVGDTVVVQTLRGDRDGIEGSIGILVRRTANAVVIRKLNPDAEIELRGQFVHAIHKVLTWNEAFGV